MGTKAIDKIAMFLAELLGTALLLFLGCMGCMSWTGQPTSSFQSAFTFGMVVMLIIQAFGCISGAHLNPVVTLAAIVYDLISVQVSALFVCVFLRISFQKWQTIRAMNETVNVFFEFFFSSIFASFAIMLRISCAAGNCAEWKRIGEKKVISVCQTHVCFIERKKNGEEEMNRMNVCQFTYEICD